MVTDNDVIRMAVVTRLAVVLADRRLSSALVTLTMQAGDNGPMLSTMLKQHWVNVSFAGYT